MRKIAGVFFCLLSFGAYAQTNSANPLLNADLWKTKPSVEVVKELITKGNDPSEKNKGAFDPVVMAINAGAPYETIVLLLNQKGNDVNKMTHDGRQYLHWAASSGNTQVIKLLLSKGAKTNIVDSKGATPLNFAASASQKNLEVYDLLIKAGANLKKDLTHEGANALLLAVGGDNDLSITDYFKKKISVKSKSKQND